MSMLMFISMSATFSMAFGCRIAAQSAVIPPSLQPSIENLCKLQTKRPQLNIKTAPILFLTSRSQLKIQTGHLEKPSLFIVATAISASVLIKNGSKDLLSTNLVIS